MLSGIEIQEAVVRQNEFEIGKARLDKGICPFTGKKVGEFVRSGRDQRLDFQNQVKNRPRIKIDPFNAGQLNPNSYNVRLAPELLVYDIPHHNQTLGGFEAYVYPLDMKRANPTRELTIPRSGLILEPGVLYLGSTIEYTEAHNVVPQLNGRSSTGRLGLDVHATAGFGDVGFCGTWTLEMSVIHPLRIYAGVEIAQLAYFEISLRHETYRSNKYQGQRETRASGMHKDFGG